MSAWETSETPEFRLYRTASTPRCPEVTLLTYVRLLGFGLLAAADRGAGRYAVFEAWVPSALNPPLVDLLDSEGFACLIYRHNAQTQMSRLRITRVLPEDDDPVAP